jgi:hypothetical protein
MAAAKRTLQVAVGSGSLSVPEEITEIEGELKSKWRENERGYRRVLMESRRAGIAQLGANRKRSREETSPSDSQTTIIQSQSDQSSRGQPLLHSYKRVRGLSFKEGHDDRLPDIKPEPAESEHGSHAGLPVPHELQGGRYQLKSRSIGSSSEEDFDLTLAFDMEDLWGAFHFNLLWGVIHLPQLPILATDESLAFDWHGQCQGGDNYTHGQGWLRLLGNGKIRGEINWLGKNNGFSARKDAGTPRTKAITVQQMKKEWLEYADAQ